MGCMTSSRNGGGETSNFEVQTSDHPTSSDGKSTSHPFGGDVLDLTGTASNQSETATSSNLNLTYVESKSPRTSLLRGRERRVIFISLHHLNQTYKTIPAHVLNRALFCFGAKAEWLLPKSRSEREAAEKSFLGNKRIDDTLKTIIQSKHQEGLVIWVEPKVGTYQHVSDCLITIDDPATGGKYNNLILEEDWWLNEFGLEASASQSGHSHKSRYGVSGQDVIDEISGMSFKYNPTMELLYQSNPSLIPMKHFDASKLAPVPSQSPTGDLVVIDE